MTALKFLLITLICTEAVFAAHEKHNSKNKNDIPFQTVEGEFSDDWETWKKLYKKEYKNSEEETAKYSNWLRNLRFINKHNLKASLNKHSFTAALNEFADLSIDDVRNTMNGYKMNKKDISRMKAQRKVYTKPDNFKAPDRVDWREHGYVTGVKNQGQCGSCWSFSSTGSLEGQHFAATGQLVSLSEQNLLDCTRPYGNDGCDGGLMDNAFLYILYNGGIDTESSYPYEGEEYNCRFRWWSVGATVSNFYDVIEDENALKEVVAAVGPISIAIDASHMSFQHYSGGVYDEPSCSSSKIDHAVLLVGYGTDNGKDYWLVKNSWGISWGEQGYIRMSRNKNNQCGIASLASFPVV